MKSARSTATGLLVGPVIAVGLLAGAAQAAHAATPATDGAYTPVHHARALDWARGHDHDGDRDRWGWNRGWDRNRGWDWRHGWRHDRRWGWDHRRWDPRWGYRR